MAKGPGMFMCPKCGKPLYLDESPGYVVVRCLCGFWRSAYNDEVFVWAREEHGSLAALLAIVGSDKFKTVLRVLGGTTLYLPSQKRQQDTGTGTVGVWAKNEARNKEILQLAAARVPVAEIARLKDLTPGGVNYVLKQAQKTNGNNGKHREKGDGSPWSTMPERRAAVIEDIKGNLPYKQIAARHNTTADQVGMIARWAGLGRNKTRARV